MSLLSSFGSYVLLGQTELYLENMKLQGGILRIEACLFTSTYLGEILKHEALVQVAESERFFFFCREGLLTALKAKSYGDTKFYILFFPVCVLYDIFTTTIVIGDEVVEMAGVKKIYRFFLKK